MMCKFGYSDVFDKIRGSCETYIGGWFGLSPLSSLLPRVVLESLLGKIIPWINRSDQTEALPTREGNFVIVGLDYSFRMRGYP